MDREATYIKLKKKSIRKIQESEMPTPSRHLEFNNTKRPIRHSIEPQHKSMINVSGYTKVNDQGQISVVNQYMRRNNPGLTKEIASGTQPLNNQNANFKTLDEGRKWASEKGIATREGRYNNTLQELQGKPNDETLKELYDSLKTTSDRFQEKLNISKGDPLSFDMTGKNDRKEIGFMNSINFMDSKTSKVAGLTNNGDPIVFSGNSNPGTHAYNIDPSYEGQMGKLFGEVLYKSLPTKHQELWNDIIIHQSQTNNHISQSGRNIGSDGFGEYVSGLLANKDLKSIPISNLEGIAKKHNMNVNFKNKNSSTHISMDNIVKYMAKTSIKK